MLLWLSLSLFLDLHISSTFDWATEALDVSSFFCGGCSVKSNDSASQDCRTVYMLRMRKAAGQQERTQKLFMWWKYFSGSGQYYLDRKSLLNIHFVSVLVICTVLVFPLFHPPPQRISGKSQFSQNSRKIFQRLRERQITAVHRLPFLMKDEDFAVSILCSKARGAARHCEGMIWC